MPTKSIMDEDGVGSGPESPPVAAAAAAAAASGGAGAGENDASGNPNNNDDNSNINNNEDSGDNSSSTTNNERWTCDACGCNTNTPTDRNCTVCGTANGKLFCAIKQLMVKFFEFSQRPRFVFRK